MDKVPSVKLLCFRKSHQSTESKKNMTAVKNEYPFCCLMSSHRFIILVFENKCWAGIEAENERVAGMV